MPIVAVFQSPSLTREKYEQVVRKLTGGKRSRMESTADWPVAGILAHAAGQSVAGADASQPGLHQYLRVPLDCLPAMLPIRSPSRDPTREDRPRIISAKGANAL